MTPQPRADVCSRKILREDDNPTFEIPFKCPYCQCKLSATVTSWSRGHGEMLWEADGVEIDFSSEPDIDGPDWEEWLTQHSYMPYVYMLPIDIAALKWINDRCVWLWDEPDNIDEL